MRISEIFGYGVDNHSKVAWDSRNRKQCPFRNSQCTKSSRKEPIGICSLSDGVAAAALCPVRFLERDLIFKDAARLAFGTGVEFGVFPEMRILNVKATEEGGEDQKIGKVDFIIGKIENEKVTDFAAVEVQAVYFSGKEIRTPLKYFLKNRSLDLENSDRRPDFRSSAQKRLIPQLQLKVPVFRRWGKKFFVVVDTQFFDALPSFPHTTKSNSELTWLAYPIRPNGPDFAFGDVQVNFSEWDEVRNALREGVPPDPNEIVCELQRKLISNRVKTKVLQS